MTHQPLHDHSPAVDDGTAVCPTTAAGNRPSRPESRPTRHKSDEPVHFVDSPHPSSQTNRIVIVSMTNEFWRRILPMPGWLRAVLYGFAYWLAFLLVLEPGNVLRSWQAGYLVPLGREAARISGAALLGATMAAPAQLWLTRTFPLVRARLWPHASIHLAGNTSLAFTLILASCFLAAWGFEGRLLPSLAEVWGQLVSNWALLVFALCAFTAIAHLVEFFQPVEHVKIAPVESGRATRVSIKTGGRLRFVEQADIDWIESQGNYLSLHTGPHTQLIRRTLTDFEADLDAGRFVRIHRRVIVAVDRIREMKPLTNGDAMLQLLDGQELRVSRSYRETVRDRWARR